GLTPEQVEELDARTKELVFLGVTSVGSQAIARLVTTDVVTALLKRIGVRVAAKSAAQWVPVVSSAAAPGISYTSRRRVGNRRGDRSHRADRPVIERSGPAVDVPGGGPTGGPAN